MLDTLRSFLSRTNAQVLALPIPAILAVGLATAGGVGAGGYYAYRSYDYVQHDNDFCISCHLMQEPYEKFAQSAHRGLGCKACHQPSTYERSSMAVAQVVENPDSLTRHAEVPNEVCETCHIEGDPDQWRLIESSVGHRIHLESADSALTNVECVECHSSSVHEFAAVDRTCAQSGCHEDSSIQLGEMGDLMIHCAACHGFSTPVPDSTTSEAFADAIQPDRDTCLSCHAMRVLAEMPDPDPHEGACGACHNPHEQSTPEEAVASCGTAACHTDLEEASTFHVGLTPGALDDCMSCHAAHDFHVDGANCLACHQDVFDDEPGSAGRVGALPVPTPAAVSPALHASFRNVADVAIGWWAHTPSPQEAQELFDFAHAEHRDVDCAECHETETSHGGLVVATVTDCRSCHHTEPTSQPCASCHEDTDDAGDPHSVLRPLDLSTGAVASRALPFEHEDHVEESCETCHTDGVELSAADVACASCHEEHHDPDSECRSCHVEAPLEAHPIAQAHVTCSGAGCHEPAPFEAPPRNRSVCLSCHQDMDDHRPEEQNCAECHALPGGDDHP